MSDKFKELKDKREQLKKDMLEESKRVFKEESATLFQTHPQLFMFTWTQYTPYFNDGDACVFGSNHEYPTVVLQSGKEAYEADGQSYEETYAGEGDEAIAESIEEAITKFLSQFDDEDMEAMFGDHVEVKVTKDGVEVEEYEHD